MLTYQQQMWRRTAVAEDLRNVFFFPAEARGRDPFDLHIVVCFRLGGCCQARLLTSRAHEFPCGSCLPQFPEATCLRKARGSTDTFCRTMLAEGTLHSAEASRKVSRKGLIRQCTFKGNKNHHSTVSEGLVDQSINFEPWGPLLFFTHDVQNRSSRQLRV